MRSEEFFDDLIGRFPLYTGQSLHVTKRWDDEFWLMERDNATFNTEYHSLIRLSREEAEWICVKKVFGKNTVTEWMDALKS